MTKNTYSAKESEATNSKIEHRLYFLFISIMCLAILVVSFMAFLKIENNLHAFLVFIVGTALNAFIFINARNP